MTHFKSDDLALLQRFGIAWHYQSPAGTPASRTLLILMNTLRAFLGADINAEILVANPWEPHLLLVDAYKKDRMFLVGDAAHQYIPTGG